MTSQPTRHLVLLGAGLVHVHLLAHLHQHLYGKAGQHPNVKAGQHPRANVGPHPLAGAQVTLITPGPQLIYGPMLAGFVAGRHTLEDCSIALEPLLAPLVAQGNIRWLRGRATSIDATARRLQLDDGQDVAFDCLSINTAPRQDREALEVALPGAREHGLFVYPVDTFCALWPRVTDLAATRALRVAVIGGLANTTTGIATDIGVSNWPNARLLTVQTAELAIELALAIRHRLPGSAVTLITGGPPLGDGEPALVQKRLAEALRQRNVTVLADAATRLEGGQILLASGARLACDVPVIATGANPPPWLGASGLATDSQGQIAVDANAQSTSHPHVFATGQSTPGSRYALFKSVRKSAQVSAPVAQKTPVDRLLAEHGQLGQLSQHGLRLISCGDGQAVAAWGRYAASGRWAGWLKHRLDLATLAHLRGTGGQSDG